MDRVTGRFDGPNCRGEEKVRRLREAFGDDIRLEAAYGDTSGDRAMLALADEARHEGFPRHAIGGAHEARHSRRFGPVGAPAGPPATNRPAERAHAEGTSTGKSQAPSCTSTKT